MNPVNFPKYLPFLLRKKFIEKFIMIESDDWGMERALSEETIEWMKVKFGEDKFSRWTTDSLETSKDLNELFDLIENFKNKFEYPPIITANFIMNNVDYSNKENLNFISITDGFNPASEDVRSLYKEGIEKKYIYPQLHGYTHYNLTEMKKYFYTNEGKEAFEKNFFVGRSTIRGNFSFLQGELSANNLEVNKIKEAAEEFRNFFGFSSKTVIPPTFIFDIDLIKILKENSIGLIQSSNRLTTSKKNSFRMPYFQKRKGIYWSIRNARLDPRPDYNFYYEQCLDSIDKAFKNNTPAIIDFHRVNFAGRFAPEYRQTTMKELKLLFSNIHKRWPEAKFIHSQELSDILWQQETR